MEGQEPSEGSRAEHGDQEREQVHVGNCVIDLGAPLAALVITTFENEEMGSRFSS